MYQTEPSRFKNHPPYCGCQSCQSIRNSKIPPFPPSRRDLSLRGVTSPNNNNRQTKQISSYITFGGQYDQLANSISPNKGQLNLPEGQVIMRYPVVHDIQLVESKPKYQSVEDIERPLKQQYLLLQRELSELQMIAKQKSPPSENNKRLNELQEQANSLTDTIRNKNQQIQKLNEQYQQLVERNGQRQNQIYNLEDECDSWKQKFTQLNQKLAETNGNLAMKLAETESIQKQRQQQKDQQRLNVNVRDSSESSKTQSSKNLKNSMKVQISPKQVSFKTFQGSKY